MPLTPPAIRNIGILAHIDAGKTTLTEQLLHVTGAIRRAGSVEDGSTVTDWMVQEQERGITIASAAISCQWRGTEITIVDTPGHVDFTMEVERSLRVLDGCVVVISGPDRVQAQTETVWHQASRHGVPAVGFVNKLDRPGHDEEALLASIRERLGVEPVQLHLPVDHGNSRVAVIDVLGARCLSWGEVHKKAGARAPTERALTEDEELERQLALERIIDAVASYDDAFAELILAGETPSRERYLLALKRAVLARGCLPLLYGAARAGVGIQAVADGVVALLPGPEEARSRRVYSLDSGQRGTVGPGEPGSAAFVFKTETRRRGRLVYVRCFAGRVEPGDKLFRQPAGVSYVPERLVRVFGGDLETVAALEAGMIGGILHAASDDPPATGDTLSSGDWGWTYERVDVPRPVIGVVVEAEDADGDRQMREALRQLVRDDPSLIMSSDPETGQVVLSGMGELHLELACERVRREHGLALRVGTPRARRRHLVTGGAEGRGVFDTGTVPHSRVEVDLRVAPIDGGLGQIIRFEGDPPGRASFRDALEAGLHAALEEAFGTGVVGVEVTLERVSDHGVDPHPVGFRNAAYEALGEALAAAETVHAEPWMSLSVVAPDEAIGRVVGELSRRRGKIRGSETRGTMQVLIAEAPLAELIGYATALRSLTAGRGIFTMEPVGYRAATN